MWGVAGAIAFAFAAVISVAIIIALRPWLRRVALAKPNARSSHREPTPQGGGIAVVAATIVTAFGTLYFSAPAATRPTVASRRGRRSDRGYRRRRRHSLDWRRAAASVAGACRCRW